MPAAPRPRAEHLAGPLEDVLGADSLGLRALPVVDYFDVYATPVGKDATLEDVAQRVLGGRPPGLMRMRDALVRPFGLKTSPPGRRTRPTFAVGERLGIFTLFARSEAEMVLGEDDQHLDFRVCLRVPGDGQATLATLVHFHNFWGRAYFFLVRPFHGLVVRRMLSRLSALPEGAR